MYTKALKKRVGEGMIIIMEKNNYRFKRKKMNISYLLNKTDQQPHSQNKGDDTNQINIYQVKILYQDEDNVEIVDIYKTSG